MKIAGKQSAFAFTLTEMMVAIGCASIILAAVLISAVALQRTFAAEEAYSTAESQQLRVLDYVAMDCRRSLTATVANNILTLTVPVYYDSSINAVSPTLTLGVLSYGTGSATITYGQSGTNFNRTVTVTDGSGHTTTTTTAIATNVAGFTVASQDLTSSLKCSVFFFPTFTRMAGSGTWRNGGTTPDSSVGANGDYYLIDTTATDNTTVGNVYFKAGNSYSLLQNIKATIVCCNTFLRNASARH